MTLLEAVQRLARKLVVLRSGTADAGGNTTTLVDADRFENDDDWNDAIIINVTNGELGRVTDFVGSSGTFTTTTMTAHAENDKYVVILPSYPKDVLFEAINGAIQELKIPTEDSTSLDTIASVTEYDLPAGINKRTLRQVYVRRDTSGNVDYDWQLLHNWYPRPKGIGNQEVIVFGKAMDAGLDLRFVYTINHPILDDLADTISEYIPLEKWLPQAAVNAIESRSLFASMSKQEERRLARFERDTEKARGVIIPLPPVTGRIKAKW